MLDFLGNAVALGNVHVMLLSCFTWELLRRAVLHFLSSSSFSPKEIRRLSISFPAFVHAVFISTLALYFILTHNRPQSLYERIPLSEFMFGIACGYFAWDVVIVLLVEDKFHFPFFLHAVFCVLAYLFGLFPFLTYYGVYFLLFELSTPWMHIRSLLLSLNGEGGQSLKRWIQIVEGVFAFVFILVRIGMGFPMSVLVWRDLLKLMWAADEGEVGGIHQHHPVKLISCFYLVANIGLNGLNVAWIIQMGKKKLRNNQKKAHSE